MDAIKYGPNQLNFRSMQFEVHILEGLLVEVPAYLTQLLPHRPTDVLEQRVLLQLSACCPLPRVQGEAPRKEIYEHRRHIGN
jgi:hypothetical protein